MTVTYRDRGPSRPWPIPRAFNFYANFEKNVYWNGGFKTFNQLFSTTRSSMGYSEDSNGNFVQFGANEPRRTDQGLLIEPESTNINPYTQAANNWNNTAGASSSVIANDFAGIISQAQVVESGGTGNARVISIAFPVVAGKPYSITYWYKAGSSGKIRLTVNEQGLSGYSFLSGPVTSLDGISNNEKGTFTLVAIRSISSGFEAKVSWVPNFTGGAMIGIGPDSSVTAETVLAIGGQVELGTLHTSPILTTGSASTRQGDVIKHNFGDTSTTALGVGGVLIADVKSFDISKLPVLLGFNPTEEVSQVLADEAMEASSMAIGLNTFVFAASNSYTKVRRFGQSDIAAVPSRWRSDITNMSLGGTGFNDDNNLCTIFKKLALKFDSFDDDKFSKMYSLASAHL